MYSVEDKGILVGSLIQELIFVICKQKINVLKSINLGQDCGNHALTIFCGDLDMNACQ